MECPICKRDRLCFWCKASEATVVACIECAIANGFRLMEEVLEVKGEGMEAGSSRERQSLPRLRNNGKQE